MIGVGVSLRNLRNSVSATALSQYAVLGFEPPLVLDFGQEFFRTGGAATDLVSAATHARAGNATMVDSDGLLKWAPHNLLTYSEDFSNAAWTKTRATATANYIAMDATNANTHSASRVLPTQVIGASYVFEVEIKADAVTLAYLFLRNESSVATQTWIDLTSATIGTDTSPGATATPLSDGWVLCVVPFNTPTADTTASLVSIHLAETDNVASIATAVEGAGFFVRNARYYRSDLGGMVNNPDTGNSYVPTTSAARYLPRRGHHIYNGAEWVNEGVLVESEARTNLVTWSEDFTKWVNGSTIDLGGQANSLTGLSNATLFYPASSGTNRFIYLASAQASAIYTSSVFAKAQNKDVFYISLSGGGSPAYFNLSTGTVGTVSAGYEARIEPFGDGWYRCSVYNVTATANSFTAVYGVADGDGSTSVTANGTDGIYIYGAQFEAGSTPSSYIPNAGTSLGVIRAADTITVPSANLPWNPLAVSIQMQGRLTYADDGSQVDFYSWAVNSSNRIIDYIATSGANTGQFRVLQVASGVADTVSSSATAYSPGINVPFNIAARHGSTFINGAVDGTALTADLTPTALPDLSSTNLSLAFDYMGCIKLFRMFADDLGDSGIAEASA